jgi:hypothetical protein
MEDYLDNYDSSLRSSAHPYDQLYRLCFEKRRSEEIKG